MTPAEIERRKTALPTHALTLDAPFAWAVAHSDKRAENRTWKAPKVLDGARFAIHAGAKVPKAEEIAELREWVPGLPDTMTAGAIVATARLIAYAQVTGEKPRMVALTACMPDVDEEHALDLITVRKGLYCEGPVIWVLDDVIALDKPIACKGAQRVWRLLPAIVAQLAKLTHNA